MLKTVKNGSGIRVDPPPVFFKIPTFSRFFSGNVPYYYHYYLKSFLADMRTSLKVNPILSLHILALLPGCVLEAAWLTLELTSKKHFPPFGDDQNHDKHFPTDLQTSLFELSVDKVYFFQMIYIFLMKFK